MAAIVGQKQILETGEDTKFIPIWNDPGLPTLWIYPGDSDAEEAKNRQFAERVANIINEDTTLRAENEQLREACETFVNSFFGPELVVDRNNLKLAYDLAKAALG